MTNSRFSFSGTRLSLGNRVSLPTGLRTILLVFFAGLCHVEAATSPKATERFLWDQANTQMMAAVSPAEYINAAETYRRLLTTGIVNPSLLNNLGCALTLGGDYKNAQAAFERAERFSGTTLESTVGIQAAIARAQGSADAEEPWYRTAFFWHFALPARIRIVTTLAGWSLLWTGLLLLILRRRRTGGFVSAILPLTETCIFAGALIFLLFGSSSLFSIIQENHAETYWKTVRFSVAQAEEGL